MPKWIMTNQINLRINKIFSETKQSFPATAFYCFYFFLSLMITKHITLNKLSPHSFFRWFNKNRLLFRIGSFNLTENEILLCCTVDTCLAYDEWDFQKNRSSTYLFSFMKMGVRSLDIYRHFLLIKHKWGSTVNWYCVRERAERQSNNK